MDKKFYSRQLDVAMKDFKKNPSASNYWKLENAMAKYQEYCKR